MCSKIFRYPKDYFEFSKSWTSRNKKSFGNNHKVSNCSWVVYEDENLLEMLTCEEFSTLIVILVIFIGMLSWR